MFLLSGSGYGPCLLFLGKKLDVASNLAYKAPIFSMPNRKRMGSGMGIRL